MKNYFKRYDTIFGWAAFAISAVVYLMTIEPTASLWDCSEFIATAYKLEIGHPPGAPLFMMIVRFFTMFAPSPEHVGAFANAMSAFASAFTILFMFWSITHMGRRIYGKTAAEMSVSQTWTVIGAGLIGSLAYTFTDTFWFSAVEGEVYALSSMFTAAVVWAMLRWEEVADEPHSSRWLVLIAYLMGLSIGVHILNFLAIPALVFIYYFRKTKKISIKGVLIALCAAGGLIILLNNIIMPYTVSVGAAIDRFFVNSLGSSPNLGFLLYIIILFTAIGYGAYYTYKKGKPVANTIMLCLFFIFLGYGSYASVVIRSAANPPMNSNQPDNPYGLSYLINRDQYGSQPILYGRQYSSPDLGLTFDKKYYIGSDGKYRMVETYGDYEYAPEFNQLFPRMYSNDPRHVEAYKSWGRVTDSKFRTYNGERIAVPTMGENLRYFFSYQLNYMYWRYFLWNFVGRQNDYHASGEITNGQWMSGIKAIDEVYLGPQDNLPSELANNKGHNKYYFLPFIFGLIGLIFQLNRDPKNFINVMWLFVMMGVAEVVYFNSVPGEVRERDYIYAGSFYAFCFWIGFAVICVKEWITKLAKKDNKLFAVAATAICACVPVILVAQNWDDHDRSGRYVARDLGYDYLQTTLPNSIIINYGDNDTFPLWYNQEVEGVRTDVRILNSSYMASGWYNEQMKKRYNDSEPVPFSLPQEKFMYTNEFLLVDDLLDTPTAKSVINFIASNDPRTQIDIGLGLGLMDYVPAKRIAVPVNKENVLASGIVRPEDEHLIVDTMYINIKGSTITRVEMMLMDLLANFDWKRPLFFTTASTLNALGLTEYLQCDGIAYRLVPIRTSADRDFGYQIGRIDPDYLYDNLMNKYRYGNLADPDVYCDFTSQQCIISSNLRSSFAGLALSLIERGDKERAVEVLDKAMEVMPLEQFPVNVTVETGAFAYQMTPIIQAYYFAEAWDKGDALAMKVNSLLQEYILYFTSFPDHKRVMVSDELDMYIQAYSSVMRTVDVFEREDVLNQIDEFMSLYD